MTSTQAVIPQIIKDICELPGEYDLEDDQTVMVVNVEDLTVILERNLASATPPAEDDPDAATGCADDFLPGSANDWTEKGKRWLVDGAPTGDAYVKWAGEERSVKEKLADLIHRYCMGQIGQMMHQAEHWRQNDKPLAVHHRVRAADELFQVANLFDPKQRDLGFDCPFRRMDDWLKVAERFDMGIYPPSVELHKFRDPLHVVKVLADMAGGTDAA